MCIGILPCKFQVLAAVKFPFFYEISTKFVEFQRNSGVLGVFDLFPPAFMDAAPEPWSKYTAVDYLKAVLAKF